MSLLGKSRETFRVLGEFSKILPAQGIRMDGKVTLATERI